MSDAKPEEEPPFEDQDPASQDEEEQVESVPPPKKPLPPKEPPIVTPLYTAPFARGWPSDPALIELMAAFDRGDYAFVRVEAPKLAERTKDERVKAAALEVRRRIDPDPVAGILVLVAMGLLIVLAAHYLGHRQPEDAPAPRPLRPVPRTTAS